MTPNDDEVLARLRASLHAAAARTSIGDSRVNEVALDPVGRRANGFVISMSAAAAVAVIGGLTAVAASSGSHSSGVPALAGSGSSTAPTASLNADTSGSNSLSPSSAGNGCVPENYEVIASAAEVAPYTYILPAVPAGYELYGAWGTIDRHKCAGTTTWYVEYDDAAGYGNTDNNAIQLSVTTVTARPGGVETRQELAAAATATATAPPSGPAPIVAPGTAFGSALLPVWTQVKVGADVGRFAENKAGFGTLMWTHGDLIFQLNAPDDGGDVGVLTSLAESLVHVSPTDPRIKLPADCQVQPGDVCPG